LAIACGESNFVQPRTEHKSNVRAAPIILDSTGKLADFRISTDGKTLYTLHDYRYISIYETDNFSLKSEIQTNERGNLLFIDGNDMLVVEWSRTAFEDNNIYLLTYSTN